jgi:hypothetical protein
VVRLVLDHAAPGAPPTEFVLRKVDGRWRIDDIVYHGA